MIIINIPFALSSCYFVQREIAKIIEDESPYLCEGF